MVLFYWIDRYIDLLQAFVASKIVLAPLLLLFIEEAGVPIMVPGDFYIAYTGYKLSVTHTVPFWQAFVAAQVATLAGSSILFYIARRWGDMLLVKVGRFMFIKEKDIHRVERLFARYGMLSIIFGRHIPGLRIPVTLFAGSSGVRYWVFIVSTFISSSAWIILYLYLGKRLGVDFHTEVQRYIGLSFVTLGGLTVAVILLHLIGMYREKHRQSKDTA